MARFDKLFGKKQGAQKSAHSCGGSDEARFALQVVFDEPGSYSPAQLEQTLRNMSPALDSVAIQSLAQTAKQGTPVIRSTAAARQTDRWAAAGVKIYGKHPRQFSNRAIKSWRRRPRKFLVPASTRKYRSDRSNLARSS